MTQNTIKQILEVLHYVKDFYSKGYSVPKSYQRAVNIVAENYEVTYQTIGDGCRRRLELNDINELFHQLELWLKGDPSEIKETIKNNTNTENHKIVDRFFETEIKDNLGPVTVTDKKDEILTVRIPIKNAKFLRALSEIDGVKVSDIVTDIINEYVKKRMLQLATEISESD